MKILIFGSILICSSFILKAQKIENRDLVFDSIDLRILERANEILSDVEYWNKNDDRNCEDDLQKEKYSFYCSLYKASIDVADKYVHRRPSLQLVRFAIEENYGRERINNHRLMDWNNHPDTIFEELKSILNESIKIVKEQLEAMPD